MSAFALTPSVRASVRGHSRTRVNNNHAVDRNVNPTTNVNVNRDVNVAVVPRGGCHGGCGYHPVATAAAVVATGVVVGTVVASLPPSGCSVVVVNGFT